MENLINPVRLLESLRREFDAQWVAPASEAQETAVRAEWANDPMLVNYFHAKRAAAIQVLGQNEYAQLTEMEARPADLGKITGDGVLALLFCQGLQPPEFVLNWCAEQKVRTALITVQGEPENVISYLYKNFAHDLVEKVSMHGVFMDIYGLGVMLTGKASIGKSETALEMISRGHKFVADDLVEFIRLDNDTVSGSCPEILQDMIEVRSLGILNVRRMYGNHVVLRRKVLHFIIVLFSDNSAILNQNRMRPLELEPQKILNVEIPVFPMQVRAGRNLAVLTEACVRAFLLRSQHRYDAAQEIITRQEALLG